MRRVLIVSLLFSIIYFFSPGRVEASQAVIALTHIPPLCLPVRADRFFAQDCMPLGPAGYQTRLATLGYPLHPQPFPAHAPDPSLVYLDIRYGKVSVSNAPVYGSLDQAVSHRSSGIIRHMDSPMSFVSYNDEALVDGRKYYQIEYGGWMTANEISRIGAIVPFQGLVFSRNPNRPFGWILYPVETRRHPSMSNPEFTGHQLNRYEVVQVFSTQMVDDLEWYMIGPDEWIPTKQGYERMIGRVTPNNTPPEGVTNGRWIEINLAEQSFSVYDLDNQSIPQLVFASLVATGIEPFWTRPGLFQIYQKLPTTLMRGSFEADHSDAYYLEDVPWTMYYDKARALHGAYWHNGFGAVRSHGCVNLSVGDSHWLFNWAHAGDWVYVWDPSGNTPTDPSIYGEGGA